MKINFPIRYFFIFLSIIILSCVFINPLFIDRELHDPIRMGKIFYFAHWMLLFILFGLVFVILNWGNVYNKLSLLILLWGGWIIIRGKFGGIWNDEKFFWFSGCFIFYFLSCAIIRGVKINGNQQLMLIPLLIITLVAATEAAIGILQLYGMAPVYHRLFKISGHFFNPAPYAGFLMASLPFALLLSLVKRDSLVSNTIHWLGYIAAGMILVAILSTLSRAAYLGLGAVMLVWIFYSYHPLLYIKRLLNTYLKKKIAYWGLPLLLVLILTSLYLFKKDSASGRILIWKIAVNSIEERPLVGHGFNTAQATLTTTQGDYFAAGNGTESEKMLAGSVRWSFNEFLQTASETGLIGLALLLLVVGYALFYKISASLSRQHRLVIGAARSSLVGILTFGCFSYPFYSLPVTLLFFFSLALLAVSKSTRISKQFYSSILRLSVFALIIMLAIFYIRQTPKLKQAYWQWDEAEKLYKMGAYLKANESYAEAYPILNHNGLFLQQYGKSLAMEEKYTQAIDMLCQAKSHYNDEFTGITLGNCYQSIGDYTNAEQQYKLAANTVPHKFYPLYLLAKLYEEAGQTEKATAMARELLTKEVKVSSKAIEEIKTEMQQLIDNNESFQISNKPEGKRQEARIPIQTASRLATLPDKEGGEVTKIKN